jgi:lipopolysaccharide heptosyltransferase I
MLIIKPSSLGDVVHALPFLRAVRRRFSSARIDWLINAPLAGLLSGDPDVNEVVCFDRTHLGRMGRSVRATRDFFRFVGEVRRRDYDITIDLQGLFRTGFLSRASGAPMRVGFKQSREGARWFYTQLVDTPDPEMHAVDRYLRVAEFLGCPHASADFGLRVSPEARAHIGNMLAEQGVFAADRLIAVAPAARWETKQWPAESFVEAINALQAEDGVRCVLAGSPEEGPRVRQIASSCRVAPIDLCGRTPLPELVALVERASAVLCHDSAVAHLAAALDRPLVCLTGPTNARRTGPYGRLPDVIRLSLECSPCYFRRLSQCPHHHRCMRDLPVVEVLAGVRRALENSEVRGAAIHRRHEPLGTNCR